MSKDKTAAGLTPPDADTITDDEQALFRSIISTDLTPGQRDLLIKPQQAYPRQDAVLATHFHPEHIPIPLIIERVREMFPGCTSELIIPTQHNELMTFQGYTGVEVDCYASGFNRKVQLLLHFAEEKVKNAHVLKDMIAHTFTYRSKQLHELVETIINPALTDRLDAAAAETGASGDIIDFTRAYTNKFLRLLEHNERDIPPQFIKNKLLRNFFDELRVRYDNVLINRVQVLIKAAKSIMKSQFPLKHFYRVEEIIEEVRLIGGCIVIPHPEQFWPILLADYDVDGYEVWNPQSREYTEFLITTVNKRNMTLSKGQRPILIFMGDDTHLGEKIKDPASRDPSKAAREVGYQPAWDDITIRKNLIISRASRRNVISEYSQRLNA